MINKKGSALVWGIFAVIAVLIVVGILLFAGGGTKNVSEIKNDDYVGKTVKVEGKVDSSIKLGNFQGYTLRDKNEDRIFVSSSTLPKEGSTVTAKGILMKDSLLGYYIKAE